MPIRTGRLINPPKYDFWLKGHAACNYTLNSHTLYRSIAPVEEITQPLQIEAAYKYDYRQFRIDWALRNFIYTDDDRMYGIVMITNKGIFKEDRVRDISEHEIYMRWDTFVTKLEDYNENTIICNLGENKKIEIIHPQDYEVGENGVYVKTQHDEIVLLEQTNELMKALKNHSWYINVHRMNYVPVWNFRMWYMMF